MSRFPVISYFLCTNQDAGHLAASLEAENKTRPCVSTGDAL